MYGYVIVSRTTIRFDGRKKPTENENVQEAGSQYISQERLGNYLLWICKNTAISLNGVMQRLHDCLKKSFRIARGQHFLDQCLLLATSMRILLLLVKERLESSLVVWPNEPLFQRSVPTFPT